MKTKCTSVVLRVVLGITALLAISCGGNSTGSDDGAGKWTQENAHDPQYATLSGVWGSSANDVIAVGQYGTILHYDGTRWSPMPTSGTWQWLTSVWGSSANDVFAVGDNGRIDRKSVV